MPQGDDYNWPDGWGPVSAQQATFFARQLALELAPDHPLLAHAPRAIGTYGGSDDVVFALQGYTSPFCVVHLTWPKPDTRNWLVRWLRPRLRSHPGVEPLDRLADLARFFD